MGQKVNPTLFRLKTCESRETSYAICDSSETAYHAVQDLQIKKFVARFLDKCNLTLHSLKLRKYNGKIELHLLYFEGTAASMGKAFSSQPTALKKVQYHVSDFSLNLAESLLRHTPVKPILKVIMQCTNKPPSLAFNAYTHLYSFNSMAYSLRRHYKDPSFNYFVNSLLVVVTKKDSAKFLSVIIASQLAKTKRHNLLLNFWRKSFLLLVNSSFSAVNGLKLQVKGRLNGRPRARTVKIMAGSIPTFTLSSNIDYAKHTSFTQNGTIGVCVWISV